jgi:hypothetical protein
MGNSRSVELTAAVAAAQEGVSFLFHSGCTVSRMVRPCYLILYPMSQDNSDCWIVGDIKSSKLSHTYPETLNPCFSLLEKRVQFFLR